MAEKAGKADSKRLARKRQKKTKVSDIEKNLSLLLDTGEVVLGSREGMKTLMLEEAKAVVYAENIPENTKQDFLKYAEMAGIKAIEFKGSSLKLGKLCGKLFPVSVIVVKEFGEAEL